MLQSSADAARILQLHPNAPKELIEEAYYLLISQTADLPSLQRDTRIAELGDAYMFLCQHCAPRNSELRAPRSHSRMRMLQLDPTISEVHELLAVDREADEPIVRLALGIQLRRLGRSVLDDELRRELRRAGDLLLSPAPSNGGPSLELETQRDDSAGAGSAGTGAEGASAAPTADLPTELSAARVMTRPQLATALVLVALLALGLVVAPMNTFITMTALVTAIYLVAMGYKVLLVVRSLSSSCETPVLDADIEALSDEDLPIYTVLVPLYREANVIEHLVGALNRLDYPSDRLDVKLLLEEDDVETRSAAERLDLPSHVEILIVPATSEPQGKPRACNYGLRHARGEYVVLYDAEDVPDPQQLKKALLAFRQAEGAVGCVQAKLNYFNIDQNVITRWFTIEYSTWFDLYLPGLNSASAPIPLGGTSNHFPAAMLRAVGGWDAFNVTEDADLGTRLARVGYRTLLIDSWTLEEANSRVGNWLRQRSRWVKGYMQTWLVHMRNPVALYRELGGAGFLAFQVMILGTFFVYFANPVFWVLVAVWYTTRATFIQDLYPAPVLYLASFSFFAGNFFFLVTGMVAALKRGYFEGVKYVVASYVYWALMSVAAWKALYQLIARPHYWEKTKHGLARSPFPQPVGETDQP